MKEIDKEKVIQGLEHCKQYGSLCGLDCTGFYAYMDESGKILRASEHKSNCPYRNCETGCVVTLIKDAVTLLKEKEKHGHWEIKKVWSPTFPPIERPFCSLCGGQGSTSYQYKYCPYCGAKMDGIRE